MGFGSMRLAVCKVQLKIRKEEGAMLVKQLLIGAQCAEADATPPPKWNRDAGLPRKHQNTVISLGFDAEKIPNLGCPAMRNVCWSVGCVKKMCWLV